MEGVAVLARVGPAAGAPRGRNGALAGCRGVDLAKSSEGEMQRDLDAKKVAEDKSSAAAPAMKYDLDKSSAAEMQRDLDAKKAAENKSSAGI